MLACSRGHSACVKLLLHAGADPDLRAASDGLSPLQIACLHERSSVVSELLAAGADPNAAGERHPSALHLAVHHIAPECVRALLAAGADYGPVFGGSSLLSVLQASPNASAVPRQRVAAVKQLLMCAADVRAEGIFKRRAPLVLLRSLQQQQRAIACSSSSSVAMSDVQRVVQRVLQLPDNLFEQIVLLL